MAFAGKVVVVAGPPCSGKGTQCKRLAKALNMIHVSTGDVFRDAVARETPLGLQAKGYMDRGRFVPDELMIKFVTERLAEPDVVARGCLLDGFPRTGPQARTLAAAMEVERFIVLQVPDRALQIRAAGRRIDPETGDIYNLTFAPPPLDVAARVQPRQYDDDAGTFQVRLDVFHRQIRQIVPCFGKRVWMVNAMRPPDEVFSDLKACLEATVGGPVAGGAGGRDITATTEAPAEVPTEFVCAITYEVMSDPVTTADGHVYEREAIAEWLREHHTSPRTGAQLPHKTLVSATALKRMIGRWAEGEITAEEALAGSEYAGPGTANNPIARDSVAIDEIPTATAEEGEPILAEPEPEGGGAPALDHEDDVTEVTMSVDISGDGDHDAAGVQHVVITVEVEEARSRQPVDICCVLDVSGSMGEAATFEAPDGTLQDDGLSMLDLVKHAVKTLAHMMLPEDRLALVAFSSTASLVLPPTPMGDAGRANALQALDSLTPDGATDIWSGLSMGLESLRQAAAADVEAGLRSRKSTVLLLTDGVPNEVPEGGHHAALQDYMQTHPEYVFQISTFGFGYTLDSALLQDIAELGCGSYAFVPDAKILGTVFLNSFANAVATCSQKATLDLHNPADGEHAGQIVGRVLGDLHCTTESWGVRVHLGPLQYGQSRSVAVPMAIPSLASAGARAAAAASARAGQPPPDYLRAELSFHLQSGPGESSIIAATGDRLMPTAEAALATLRCDFITTGRLAVAQADAGHLDAANAAVRSLIERFELVAANFSGAEATITALQNLQSDVCGRFSKAFDGQPRYERWGRHYIRALLRAHQLEVCTNFMDTGLKNYGGDLFRQVRDAGEPIFKSLPAPQPPPKVCPICGDPFGLDVTDDEMRRHTESHFGGPVYPAAPVRHARPSTRVVRAQTRAPDMADYYQGEGGGCFGHGSTVAILATSGDFVPTDVTAVQQGDLIAVAGGAVAEVACVVTIMEQPNATLCEFPCGLRITAKHPVRVNGTWRRPSHLPTTRTVRNNEGFVVNFLLRGTTGSLHSHGHVLLVNGVPCASWGHGMRDKGITHPFYGSTCVVEALEVASPGWEATGTAVVRGCARDENGRVCAFVAR